MVSKYAVSLQQIRDPRFKVIRKTLHKNRIGCRDQLMHDPDAACSPLSVVHNWAAASILEALDQQ